MEIEQEVPSVFICNNFLEKAWVICCNDEFTNDMYVIVQLFLYEYYGHGVFAGIIHFLSLTEGCVATAN